MDQGLKTSKYNAYDPSGMPGAGVYGQPGDTWQGDAVTGVPLYPDTTPENPRLNRFVVQGCKDLWAALLFIGVVFMTVVWGTVNMATYVPLSSNNSTNSSSVKPSEHVVLSASSAILISVLISAAGAFGMMALARAFPQQIIYIASTFTILLTLASAVVAFFYGTLLVAITSLVAAVLQALWLYCARRRIPFSAELIKVSTHVLMRHKCVFLFSFLMCILCVIYMCFWIAMIAPTTEMYMPKSGSSKKQSRSVGTGVLTAFFMLVLYWVLQVMPNIMHVTIAGVTATWYFAGEGRMPKNPTLASFSRAWTTSFGSICFGSLIVAIIRLVRWLVERAVENENEFVRCIVSCILSCLESMAEFFNTYAFVHVAVYGCGYIEAAKRTWQLCKQCFFAATFNYTLVGTTMGFLTLAVSAVIGVVIGVTYGSIFLGLLAFVISLVINTLILSAVESAVTTIFVCFAEVPEGLQQSAPDLYAALHRADQNGTNNAAPMP